MAEKYDAAQLDTAAQKMYDNIIAIYGLKGVVHIVEHILLICREETIRRTKLEKKKHGQRQDKS